MEYLPSFVQRTLDQYTSIRQSTDETDKYRALEAVYAATIKYIGTTAAVTADMYCAEPARAKVWNAIMASSGLGGWLDGMDRLCAASRKLPDGVRSYCAEYSDYKRHPAQEELDAIGVLLSQVFAELAKKGYAVEKLKKLNLLRSLRAVVYIRNKFAHGALAAPILHRIQTPLYLALRKILWLVPFEKYVFWAGSGSSTVRLVGPNPQRISRQPRARSWIESELLEGAYGDAEPFAVYHDLSQRVFFLNQAVDWRTTEAEYVDYTSGDVKYWELPAHPSLQAPVARRRQVNNDEVSRWLSILGRETLSWKRVPLQELPTGELVGEGGVYVFMSDISLGGHPHEAVLYVGRTKCMATRLKDYRRIQRKLNDSRPELSQMFEAYSRLRLLFARTRVTTAPLIERAIYEAAAPKYNLIAPAIDNLPEKEKT